MSRAVAPQFGDLKIGDAFYFTRVMQKLNSERYRWKKVAHGMAQAIKGAESPVIVVHDKRRVWRAK